MKPSEYIQKLERQIQYSLKSIVRNLKKVAFTGNYSDLYGAPDALVRHGSVVNMHPFFSAPLDDQAYWNITPDEDGVDGEYIDSMDQHAILTPLDDGWMKVAFTDSDFLFNFLEGHDTVLFDGERLLSPQDAIPYTLLIELRNVIGTEGEIRIAGKNRYNGFSAQSTGWSNFEVFPDGAEVAISSLSIPLNRDRPPFRNRSALEIGIEYLTEAEIRLSLYKGEYDGEYVPYIDDDALLTLDRTNALMQFGENIFTNMASVALRPNDGENANIKYMLAFRNTQFIIPECEFEREGFVFTGWNSKSNGSGTAYAVGDPLTITEYLHNLYAQWQAE